MAQVTDAMQAEVCEIIRESVRLHHEMAVAGKVSNEIYAATHGLDEALFSVANGTGTTAVIRVGFYIGQLVALSPDRETQRKYRQMMDRLTDCVE